MIFDSMITNQSINQFSLLETVPAVLRARDFRLYAKGGKRLVDLWQNGGAAILGHTPPSMLREIKNTASRGLYAPFPHFLEARLKKALSIILPGRNFLLYAAPPHELEALVAQGTAAIWRPFSNEKDPDPRSPIPDPRSPVLIPVIPGIQGWRLVDGLPMPLGLCALAIDPGQSISLPPGDFLPPVLLAAAARGIYDLIAAVPQRAKCNFPRIAKALNSGSSRWKRQSRCSLYLSLKETPSKEEWGGLFRRFLDAGFLLPPVSAQPLILPGILSPGEEAKLAGLFLGAE